MDKSIKEKSVKEIVEAWGKECDVKGDVVEFPDGINFFEGEKVDLIAFKSLCDKYGIPESEYFIEEDAVSFRI